MEDEEQAHQSRKPLGTTKLQEEQKAQMAAAQNHCRGCQAGAGRGPARAGKVQGARLRDSRRRAALSLLQVEEARETAKRAPAENAYHVAQEKVTELAARQKQESWMPRMCSSDAGSSSAS